MNENLNLCEILKDCPKGTKFWSPIWGDVVLKEIKDGSSIPIKLTSVCSDLIALYPNGKMFDLEEAECVLFPSKGQRDWSKFKRPRKRFNPKDFKPFDKVLIKHHYESERWVCNFFSDMLPNGEAHCLCLDVHECIPYNDETMHLLGTDEDAPEYYKWWEE